jgi:hypothetical protein
MELSDATGKIPVTTEIDPRTFRLAALCNRNEYQVHFLGVKVAGA